MMCSNFCQNIFLGEDIRKQLPRESAEFDGVNANWKVKFYFRIGPNSLFAFFLTLFLVLMQVIMQRLNRDNNALRGTHHPGYVLYVSVFRDFDQQPISFFFIKDTRDLKECSRTYLYLASFTSAISEKYFIFGGLTL